MRSHNLSCLSYLLLFLALGADAALGATAVKLPADELARVRYIREHTALGVPHLLNLADPVQHAYVLDTLRRSGNSPKRSPHLYRLLDQAKTAGSAAKPAAIAAGLTFGGVNLVTEFGPQNDSGAYFANGYSTYPSSSVPYYTNATITLFDLKAGTTINTASNIQYSETNLQVPVSGTASAGSDDVQLNALFLIAPQDGSQLQPYSVVLTDLEEISSPCQNAPTYNTSGVQQCNVGTAPSTCTGTFDPQPNTPLPTPLQVCYGNRIQSNCDYGCQGSSIPPNIIFPIIGSVTLGAAPITPLAGSLYIVLTAASGGGCVLDATTNSTALASLVSTSGNTVSWSLAPASFPNQNCVTTNGLVFDYSLQLFLQTTNGYSGVTFTSDLDNSVPGNTVLVPQIDVVQGCLPAGVQVRMADGSQRAVESFQAYGDERVRSAGKTGKTSKWETRTVSGKTWGQEEKPLVRIRDDRGHDLLLTEEHPVITTRGPVAAKNLAKGDVVHTEQGPAKLIEVGRQASPTPVAVHNLRVGSEQEAVAGEATFYANGILVGDQRMQRHLMIEAAKPGRLTKDEIVQRLPREWRQDYLNSLAGHRAH